MGTQKTYRIAVFSDLHGNPFALEVLLTAFKENGPFDRVVAAGDLAFGGSDPARCVDRIRAAGIHALYGNTEEYIHSPDKPPGDELHLKKWDRILEDVRWHREVLGDDRTAWMRGLPFSYTFYPTDDPGDGLHIFHANPQDIETMLLPPPKDQVRIEGMIRQPDDDTELVKVLQGVAPNLLAFGHYHYSSLRHWEEKQLVNISPASCPAKDKDPRTRFTIFEWNAGWNFRTVLIRYDFQKELDALPHCGLPNWRDSAKTFPGFSTL